MRAERATRVALAISWWKMHGVLASRRWPRRSAQVSTCRLSDCQIFRSRLIEHLRSRLATQADALTCSSPFTCRLCNLGEQSTEERGKTQSCPKATMAISDYLRHNLSDPGQGQRLEAGHLAPQRHGCPQTTPDKCRKVKPPDNPRQLKTPDNPRQMKPPDNPRQVQKSETPRQGKNLRQS